MKIRIYKSLFDEKVWFKLPYKIWKYLIIFWVVLGIIFKILFKNIFFTIPPMILTYLFLKLFIKKDSRAIEILVSHYKDKNKYYNP